MAAWCQNISIEGRTNIPACATIAASATPQVAMQTMLAASMPAWCNNIVKDAQQYIAACGGREGGRSEGASAGTAPSWCQDIPHASRADVPACVNDSGTPLSGSPRQ